MKIPVQRTTLHGDGTETVDTVNFHLLPPAEGKCIQCAKDHDPAAPHDPTSLLYQFRFHAQYGRLPTWADAMEHCRPPVQKVWTSALAEKGIDVNSMNVTGK